MGNVRNAMIWADERHDAKTAAQKTLDKCKKQEDLFLNQGYRYYDIGRVTQILVPCDKNGKPTAEGREKIRQMKEHLGV